MATTCELCGVIGTLLFAQAEGFVIVEETGIAKGIRRITVTI